MIFNDFYWFLPIFNDFQWFLQICSDFQWFSWFFVVFCYFCIKNIENAGFALIFFIFHKKSLILVSFGCLAWKLAKVGKILQKLQKVKILALLRGARTSDFEWFLLKIWCFGPKNGRCPELPGIARNCPEFSEGNVRNWSGLALKESFLYVFIVF